MKTRTLGVALVATAAIAGAGPAAASTATIPKAQLIERGDAICTKGNERITERPPHFDPAHATPAQLQSAAPFLRQLTKVVASDVRQVSALGVPDRGARLFARAMRGSHRLVRALRAQAAAAESGDLDAFHAASARSDRNRSGRQLARFGFEVCGR